MKRPLILYIYFFIISPTADVGLSIIKKKKSTCWLGFSKKPNSHSTISSSSCESSSILLHLISFFLFLFLIPFRVTNLLNYFNIFVCLTSDTNLQLFLYKIELDLSRFVHDSAASNIFLIIISY